MINNHNHETSWHFLRRMGPLVYGIAMITALGFNGCGSGEDKGQKKSLATKDPASQQIVSKLPFGELDAATTPEGNLPGQRLPDVSGSDAQNTKFSLADYKGKVILLDTWASW
ncbi:MAG: hypothetical protein P8M80_19075 [Pirellulaceae bacterium]|nr:hypothetical protein [Pirellulaceae bacterium]